MAALEDSPTRCLGQSWTLWAQRTGLNAASGESEDEVEQKSKREGDVMKLRKEDMALFGFCPAQDEFYLVVCELCGQVVKPQALKTHIELRHSGYSRLSGSGGGGSSSQLSGVPGRPPAKDSHRHSHHSSSNPTSGDRSGPSVGGSGSGGRSGGAQCLFNKSANIAHHGRSAVTSSSGAVRSSSPSPGSSKKNHAISSPVVRVERISSNLVGSKKQQAAAAAASGQLPGTTSAHGSMGPPSSVLPPAAIPVDKRELPSPQQPPPAPDEGTSLSVSSSSVSASVHHHGGHVMLTSPLGTLVSSGVHHSSLAAANVGSSSAVSSTTVSAEASPTTTFHRPSLPPASVGGGVMSSSSAVVASSSSLAVASVHHRLSGGDGLPIKMGKGKVPKERKMLPCKDRVYDPDKHCGVTVQETGSQCTRSLTCKAHSLAMRRNVMGRKKHFDELLADHRAAKEASLKASRGAKNKAAKSNDGDSPSLLPNVSGSSLSSLPGSSLSKSSQGTMRVNGIGTVDGGEAVTSTAGTFKSLAGNSPFVRSRAPISRNFSPSSLPRPHQSWLLPGSASPDSMQRLAAEQNQLLASVTPGVVVKEDTGFIPHHPRPAAVCTYNARQMGLGIFVFDRRLDSIRSVLRNTLVGERVSQSPPVKKLCVETKLPTVPELADTSDPYCFSAVGERDQQHQQSPHHQFSPPHRHHLHSPQSGAAQTPPPPPLPSGAGSSPDTTEYSSFAPSTKSSSNSSQAKAVAASAGSKTNSRPSAAKCKSSKESSAGGVNHVGGKTSENVTRITATSVEHVTDGGTRTNNKRKRGSSAGGRSGARGSPSSNTPPSTSSSPVSFPLSMPSLNTTSKSGTPVTCSPASLHHHHHNNNHTASTGAEVVNGQLGGHHHHHHHGTAVSRTSASGGSVRGSPQGVSAQSSAGGGVGGGYGLTPLHTTTASGLHRASGAVVTSSSSSPSSSSSVGSSTPGRPPGRRKGFSVKSTSRSSSLAPGASPKWNNTVLTGLGALSNANLLTANNHVGGGGGGCLSPTRLGQAISSNFKAAAISSLMPTVAPFPNGMGPCSPHQPSGSSVQKKLTNHVLPTNTATFSISSGSHLSLNDSSSYGSNCDAISHRGKGSKQNSSKNSSSQRSAQQPHHHHHHSPHHASSSSLPSIQPSPGGFATLTSAAVLGSNAGVSHLRLSAGGRSASSHRNNASSASSAPTSLGSMSASIPIKVLGPSQLTTGKSLNTKSFVGPDELRRPSEMQGSNTASFLPT